MSGNCAIGMPAMAMAPASVMTMAMTIANLGRSMKMLENIGADAYFAGGAVVAATTCPGWIF
jgi:hypothetical protein